ncbi:hypothetical protein FHW36_11171 [Chitinophaga polysaccharea]|uniref:Uncharacterized protein n=1 Tax=Chitinophaga polysaccharea TaxID=1293035 RepID=A0A561P718_9BACT|nr:DUF6223 family protein [Chitinophaga polysaccharea]TWF33881.1 hypothetical protein FHW36_11171 [Chitinophaga polysaccharea]
MGKITLFILSVILIVAGCLFTATKTFSQGANIVNKTGAAETKKPGLFNEGGYVKGITPARAIGLAELLLSVLSIVFAIRARKRSSLTGKKAALALGLLAITSSIMHFATTAGAVFGSGSGKAGAILAIVLSLAGIVLSGSILGRENMSGQK